MELLLGAKRTKPGSKANARRKQVLSNGAPARVPVVVLHYVDTAAQPPSAATYVAVCGERELIALPNSIDDEFANERCALCVDKKWATDFSEMQKGLLK